MSFADERRAFETRMTDNWTGQPVKYENIPFNQPDGSPWIQMTILPGSGLNASIGTTRSVQRHVGIIQFDVYVPEMTGTGTARTIADSIATIWRNKQFEAGDSGTITTYVPSYQSLGVNEGWYHGVVTVSYQRDVIA